MFGEYNLHILFRDLYVVAMTLASDHLRVHVLRADDIWRETRKVEFVNVPMRTDAWYECESTVVGLVRLIRRLEILVPPRVPRHKHLPPAGLTYLHRGEHIDGRCPREFR